MRMKLNAHFSRRVLPILQFSHQKKVNIVFQVSLTFRIRWLITTASTMLQVSQISVYLKGYHNMKRALKY